MSSQLSQESQYLQSAVEATKKGIDSLLLAGLPEQRQSAVLEFWRAIDHLFGRMEADSQ